MKHLYPFILLGSLFLAGCGPMVSQADILATADAIRATPSYPGLQFPDDCGFRAPDSWEDECNRYASAQVEADRAMEAADSMRQATIDAIVAADLTREARPPDIETPSPPRGCPGGCKTEPSWCEPPIKGNVSQVAGKTGERIYHMPGDEFYDEVEINREGEYYFCTPEEAEAAGFCRTYQ